MLHIILLILKIIGIILACILGLLILIILALLFAPLKYKVIVDYHGEIKADVKVTWLFHIVRGFVNFNKELKIKAKVLFLTIYGSDKPKKEKKPKKDKDKKDKTTKDKSDKNKSKKDRFVKKRKKRRKKHGLHSSDSIIDFEELDLTPVENKREINTLADINKNNSDRADSEADNGQNTAGMDDNSDENSSSDENVSSKQSIFDKISDAYNKLTAKIGEIINLIKDTCNKVSDAKDRFNEKVDSLKEKVNNPENREAVSCIWKELKLLLRIIRPRKYKINARIGYEDPAKVGQIFMYFSVVYGILGMNMDVEPVFGEDVMEADIFLAGRFNLFSIIRIAWRLYRKKEVKNLIGI